MTTIKRYLPHVMSTDKAFRPYEVTPDEAAIIDQHGNYGYGYGLLPWLRYDKTAWNALAAHDEDLPAFLAGMDTRYDTRHCEWLKNNH